MFIIVLFYFFKIDTLFLMEALFCCPIIYFRMFLEILKYYSNINGIIKIHHIESVKLKKLY